MASLADDGTRDGASKMVWVEAAGSVSVMKEVANEGDWHLRLSAERQHRMDAEEAAG